MAMIQDDDKLQQDPNQIAQQQGAPGISQGGSVSGGQGTSDVGSGVSTAGVGAGGTGGWTNIQAYLDANKGDTGSAQALDKTVNDQFKNEKDAYTQDSSKFLGDATKQVNDAKLDNTQADALLKHAGSNYSYSGSPSLDYGADVNKAKGALTGAYSGPNTYSYGFQNQTQQLGNDLNDNQGFNALMKHVYQGAAPGGLNSGQAELQKQLDVNNTGLVDKRKELQGKYADLGADRDNVVKNTTAGLGDLANQYGANQNALRDYYSGKQNSLNQNITGLEDNARTAFQTDSGTLGTGISSASPWSSAYGTGHQYTANDLENIKKTGMYGAAMESDGSGTAGAYRPWATQIQPSLNNFYANENSKYGGTADDEKRQFNSLLEFLNSTDNKKNQGFTVKS